MEIVISGNVEEVSSFLLELRKLILLNRQENYIPLASLVEGEREGGE